MEEVENVFAWIYVGSIAGKAPRTLLRCKFRRRNEPWCGPATTIQVLLLIAGGPDNQVHRFGRLTPLSYEEYLPPMVLPGQGNGCGPGGLFRPGIARDERRPGQATCIPDIRALESVERSGIYRRTDETEGMPGPPHLRGFYGCLQDQGFTDEQSRLKVCGI